MPRSFLKNTLHQGEVSAENAQRFVELDSVFIGPVCVFLFLAPATIISCLIGTFKDQRRLQQVLLGLLCSSGFNHGWGLVQYDATVSRHFDLRNRHYILLVIIGVLILAFGPSSAFHNQIGVIDGFLLETLSYSIKTVGYNGVFTVTTGSTPLTSINRRCPWWPYRGWSWHTIAIGWIVVDQVKHGQFGTLRNAVVEFFLVISFSLIKHCWICCGSGNVQLFGHWSYWYWGFCC